MLQALTRLTVFSLPACQLILEYGDDFNKEESAPVDERGDYIINK
jgi:hypothetical protein